MIINTRSNSKYLTKDDAGIAGITLTISDASEELVGDNLEEKVCLHFTNGNKPMLLNRTNLSLLVNLWGDDTDDWVGKKICAYNDPHVTYQGKTTGGLKLRQVILAPKQTRAELLAAAANFPEDDDLP